jgi:hypothetical protein
MNWTDKLAEWGSAHAAARDAERVATQRSDDEMHKQARELRERADRLHREIYSEMGGARVTKSAAARP